MVSPFQISLKVLKFPWHLNFALVSSADTDSDLVTFANAAPSAMSQSPLIEFHLFSKLPLELRLIVWSMASDNEPGQYFHFLHPFAEKLSYVAAILHVNSESRKEGLKAYKKIEHHAESTTHLPRSDFYIHPVQDTVTLNWPDYASRSDILGPFHAHPSGEILDHNRGTPWGFGNGYATRIAALKLNIFLDDTILNEFEGYIASGGNPDGSDQDPKLGQLLAEIKEILASASSMEVSSWDVEWWDDEDDDDEAVKQERLDCVENEKSRDLKRLARCIKEFDRIWSKQGAEKRLV